MRYERRRDAAFFGYSEQSARGVMLPCPFFFCGFLRFQESLNLKTAVDFNAEAQRRKVTQRESEILWKMGNTRIFLTE